ncbi:Longevity assurance, LAG1/LAC1 [Metarhizium album ARSEF 1941]|uniref:Longevity assurance, LAG1/LAC1 n=1 Tax=Metarhizium album (strain ARSEF 1941) TaxID=1081103 RepID=A0A0B2WWI7_METAS|nr:Longevity assurance, LAG1/LAC1 [Metarhizium album ARSEF 1941]KHO00582.1 Longevity assurance, LAG1/LAC1 [Metarhizium album ARSEF 1941]
MASANGVADSTASLSARNTVASRRRKSLNDTSTEDTSLTAALFNGANGKHDKRTPTRGTSRRNVPSLLRRCIHTATTRTWLMPLALLAVFLAIYAVDPAESNIVRPFIFLSYKQQPVGSDVTQPTQYGKGKHDITLVCFYMIVLSFTREFFMQELFRPLGRLLGIRSRGKQLRFMEQMYTALYFAFMAPFGVHVMRQTPVWYFNTRGMYQDFPHKTHKACFKFYYLFQAAYWAQQAIVMLLGLEKPRKDFKELIAHHIVTIGLIALSYRFHFTYMGIAVYLTHDISDFFFAASGGSPRPYDGPLVSKSLHYIDSPIVGPFFCMSIGIWAYLRHYQNLRILYSLLGEFRTVGPYVLNWETQQYKCWISNVIAFALLAFLQALNLFWLVCLLRIGYRYIVHSIAQDDRSEAEESEAEMACGHSDGSANGFAKTRR